MADGARNKVNYDDRLHAVYDAGRALSTATLRTWMIALARHAGPGRPLDALDLGSGSGRFTPALAETFRGRVYGVEPSEKMRAIARRTHAHPNVTYLAGRAEQIPLPEASCDLALLYFVLHHVEDHALAASELARVIRHRGLLFIRSSFNERLHELRWYRYFPRGREIDQAVFPSLKETVALFESVGFRPVALDEVEYEESPSLVAFADRLSHRAYSTFEAMTEEEIKSGLSAVEADASLEIEPIPVREKADLLVLVHSSA